MKVVAAVVGVIILAIVIAVVAVPRFTGGGSNEGEVTNAEGSGLEIDRGDGANSDADRDPPKIRIDDEALARLEAELEAAEPYQGKTAEERLAAAWEWVNANRDPNNPYNELEAKLLSLWDVMLDGEQQSALWLMNASLIEFEMTRALDADGDGIVSDEEMQAFRESGVAQLNGMEHPYLVERLDTDGDGELSQEETMAVMALMSDQGAFAGAIERARVDKWDTNNDGVLSDSEREEGQAGGGDHLKDMIEQQITALEEAGTFDGEDGEARRAEVMAAIEAQLGDEGSEQMRQINEMMIAQELMEAMRVENMDQQAIQAEMMASMPTPPDYTSFDADGEPGFSETEQAAFDTAMADYQQKIQDFTADATSNYMRAQFEHAAGQSDANGDGRMTPDEWDARLDMLLAERDQRLFRQSYDIDGDGSVGQTELTNFIDWHRAGSLRADSNYDGTVDARDLEFMMINYQRQGG